MFFKRKMLYGTFVGDLDSVRKFSRLVVIPTFIQNH